VLDQAEALIKRAFPDAVFTSSGESLEAAVVRLLMERAQTLATAESCTGGYLAHRVTNVPGSSAVFLAGHITYANEAKQRELNVASSLFEQHGAVSEPVARAMAEGARRKAHADYALATTGIAGPAGGSGEKPVGTVFIALACRTGETIVEESRFLTDRETFKQMTTQAALEMLRRRIIATLSPQ
jgi:nicotinamide-nucleotide amidase